MYPVLLLSLSFPFLRDQFDEHRFNGELGSIPGHFGPVETLAFSPDGRSFVSGGLDGYVRINHFDDSYPYFPFSSSSFYYSHSLLLLSSLALSLFKIFHGRVDVTNKPFSYYN